MGVNIYLKNCMNHMRLLTFNSIAVWLPHWLPYCYLPRRKNITFTEHFSLYKSHFCPSLDIMRVKDLLFPWNAFRVVNLSITLPNFNWFLLKNYFWWSDGLLGTCSTTSLVWITLKCWGFSCFCFVLKYSVSCSLFWYSEQLLH